MMYTSLTLLQLRCNLFYLTIAFDYTYLLGHKLIYECGSFIFLQEDLNFLLVGFLSNVRSVEAIVLILAFITFYP